MWLVFVCLFVVIDFVIASSCARSFFFVVLLCVFICFMLIVWLLSLLLFFWLFLLCFVVLFWCLWLVCCCLLCCVILWFDLICCLLIVCVLCGWWICVGCVLGVLMCVFDCWVCWWWIWCVVELCGWVVVCCGVLMIDVFDFLCVIDRICNLVWLCEWGCLVGDLLIIYFVCDCIWVCKMWMCDCWFLVIGIDCIIWSECFYGLVVRCFFCKGKIFGLILSRSKLYIKFF